MKRIQLLLIGIIFPVAFAGDQYKDLSGSYFIHGEWLPEFEGAGAQAASFLSAVLLPNIYMRV